MRKTSQWEFDFYALSLPHGHGFSGNPSIAAWSSDGGNGCGIVTQDMKDNSFGHTDATQGGFRLGRDEASGQLFDN